MVDVDKAPVDGGVFNTVADSNVFSLTDEVTALVDVMVVDSVKNKVDVIAALVDVTPATVFVIFVEIS